MENFLASDFLVERLGSCKIPSPLDLSKKYDDNVFNYIDDKERVLFDSSLRSFQEHQQNGIEPITFEKAGPKEFIYYDPSKIRAAIVTCGGLCPGLNNVIRGIIMQLHSRYKVTRTIGIRYGYEGFIPKYNHDIIELNPQLVEDIHNQGGSILGSSRGDQNVEEIVDALERMNVNILFAIGGDGTLRGANAIKEEITKRGLKISVAGIPKTIDNDINFIEKSFGFETSFTVASRILRGAHNEAKGAFNGIALVKLMGRDSGFIAANASLAVQEVNFVIIPEMEIELEGPNGFLSILKRRLERKQHALIAVAEGAGQNLFDKKDMERDKSGNIKYQDIGILLKEKIEENFKSINFPFTLKYIDPSYIIRSAEANANDSLFCNLLAQNAVHAAMAGRTGFVVGYWNSQFTTIPIHTAVRTRKRISIEGELWSNVLETTGQPKQMTNSK
ncbi:MAG: ATP-dependent 6-phosphofructokinase [Bacteroidota bacterium]|nr:MAG: ATP-dependent 6-phosphofructokinase [Bacteroidota bacterium]